MPETHAARRERLQAVLATSDADAALITSLVNVHYLTGLASSNAALLVPADGRAVLATDSRYALTAQRDCADLEPLIRRPVESALAGWACSSPQAPSKLKVELRSSTATASLSHGMTAP